MTPTETPTETPAQITVHHGDALAILPTIASGSIHAVVTDPPYNLAYRSSAWDDKGSAKRYQMWCWRWARECRRVLTPGGHLLAFGGTRTYHRLAAGIEDADFEIRDSIAWLSAGRNMPKGINVAKAITATERNGAGTGAMLRLTAMKANYKASEHDWDRDGYGRQHYDGSEDFDYSDAAQPWVGWHTALMPAHEQIVVARKPLQDTVVATVLEHGTGALHIDAARFDGAAARWPTNVALGEGVELGHYKRFFYCPKAGSNERPELADGYRHATVKPLALMRWLVRLVTPPHGTVLDPFLGSGSTALACQAEGFACVGIELDARNLELARKRLDVPAARLP